MKFGVLFITLLVCGWGCRQHTGITGKGCIYKWGPVSVDRERIFLGPLAAGMEYIDSLRVYNSTDQPILLGIVPRFSDLVCEAADLQLAPRTTATWLLRIRIKGNALPGEAFEMIAFQVDRVPLAGCALPVRVLITQNFENQTEEQLRNAPVLVIDDSVKEVETEENRETADVLFCLENKGKSDLKIQKVETTCGCVETETDRQSIPAGNSGWLRVRIRIGQQEEFQQQCVRVYCNAPASPVREIWIKNRKRRD